MKFKDCYKIINGDCLEEMRKMADNSIDYIFTSPPYNDSAKTKRDIETKRHCKYKETEYRKDWFEWQCEVIDEMLRITKEIVMYNIQPILSNKKDVYRLIGKYADKIDQIIIWYKPNAQPQHYEHRIANAYEMVLILRGGDFDTLYVEDNISNVVIQNINSDREYNEIHRAIMSKGFADYMIQQFTKEETTVLDPFSGLATTGIACINQNRKYIGIEKDKEYADLSIKRIEKRTLVNGLFDEL